MGARLFNVCSKGKAFVGMKLSLNYECIAAAISFKTKSSAHSTLRPVRSYKIVL